MPGPVMALGRLMAAALRAGPLARRPGIGAARPRWRRAVRRAAGPVRRCRRRAGTPRAFGPANRPHDWSGGRPLSVAAAGRRPWLSQAWSLFPAHGSRPPQKRVSVFRFSWHCPHFDEHKRGGPAAARAWPGYFAGFCLVTLIGGVSGTGTPSRAWLTACQVKVLGSIRI